MKKRLWSLFSTSREAIFLLTHPGLLFRTGLDEAQMATHPMEQFAVWYGRAKRCRTLEFPNAVCLSTMGLDGYPEGRMVLVKGFDQSGFVFYTNTSSAKGSSLMAVPRAGLTFYWGPLQWQVRVVGDVTQVSDQEADSYFASRPRESQIGAWASKQSEVLDSRNTLVDRMQQYRAEFSDKPVPRPPHWSGFKLTPRRVEFWQLRLSRLHDRLVYRQEREHRVRADEQVKWRIERLNP